MVANPNTLYLQEIPNSYSGKIIQLTFVNEEQGNISSQDLAMLLAAMTQTLLTDMSKTVQFLAQQSEANAEASQLSAGAAKSEAQQAEAAEKSYAQKLDAQENPPWWQVLINVLVKYVLPIVMCIVAAVIFGPAAGLIAGAVFLATTVPISNGKSLVSLISSSIAEGLGKDFGWSAGTIELVQGVLNVAIAVGLALVGGGVASAASAGEAVAETATLEVSDAVASTVEETVSTATEEESSAASTLEDNSGFKFNTSAGRFTAFNTFASTTANTNSWYDIAFGTWQIADQNPNDKENGKRIAQMISMFMNLIVALSSMVGSYSAVSQALQETSNLSTFAKFLGGNGRLFFQRILTGLNLGINGAAGASTINQGVENNTLEQLAAAVTTSQGHLNFIEGVDHMASQNNAAVNASLKNALSQYDTMLGKDPDYASELRLEAKMMGMCNNKA